MASHYTHHPAATTATLLLGLFSATCGAMTPTNGVEFLFPTKGTTLHYNDYVQVQYTSNFSDPWLVAFCSAADGHIGSKASQSVGGYNNTATVKLDWSGSDTPCWFDLKPNSTAPGGSGANSDQWSYDVSQRAATTVGLPATSTATPVGTSTPTSGTSTGPSSATSTSSMDESGGGGLSTGAQAGIGVGVAIGGIILGAVAVLLFMRRRRRAARKAAAARIEADTAGAGMSSGAGEVKYPGGYQSDQQQKAPPVTGFGGGGGGYSAPQELHGGSAPVYEMPTHAD